MEGTIFILVLLAFGAFLFHRLGNESPRRNTTKQNPRLKAAASPLPFDAKTATPLPKESVLSGSAYIIDGDTIRINKTQIQLFGIDAPEINHPFGKKAKWALVSLCKGHTIRAETTEIDAFGRTVAKCYLEDGRDLSAEMIKLGLAIDWPKYSGGIYRSIETSDARKRLWLADARQKGRMHVWEQFDYDQ